MIQNNIDKSWKCPCRRELLNWSKDVQGFVCPKCKEVFVKSSQINFKKPPGLIEKVKSYFKKK
jgi:hypothetical protein